MAEIGNWDTMREHEKHGPYDFTVNGECSGCGQCCSNFLPVASHEIKAIKRYVEKHGIKEQSNCFPVSTGLLDLTCPFRSESERVCLIYPVRPEICRSFKCDHDKSEVMKNKKLLHKRYKAIDMRSEFFGHEDNARAIVSALFGMAGDKLYE